MPLTKFNVDVDMKQGQTMGVHMLTTMLSMVLLGQVHSDNFYVDGDKKLAAKISVLAEEYRRSISMEWFGSELPKLPTSISFKVGKPFSSVTKTQYFLPPTITITGSKKEILYVALPHEVAHSVTLMKLSAGLPLWASEGISMMCEEEDLHSQIIENTANYPLVELLDKTDYPLFFKGSFYAQSYSLTRFLVEHKGKRAFTRFLGEQRTTKDWDFLVKKHYGYKSVIDLEIAWQSWHQKTFRKVNRQK